MVRTAALLIVVINVTCGFACSRSQETPPESSGGAIDGAAVETLSPWQVTEHGAGPIRAGMTIAEAEKATATRLSTSDATSECTYVRPSPGPDGLMFMVVAGRIVRVDVTTPDVPTEKSVRVGDTEARVREVFGERVTVSPHKYTDGHYLTVAPDPEHRLVFESDGERVTRYRAGRLPEVEWVEGCA